MVQNHQNEKRIKDLKELIQARKSCPTFNEKLLRIIFDKFILTYSKMPFLETRIEGLLLFEPQILNDERGYFFESFNQRFFEEKKMNIKFVQDNQSFSTFGVLRGLHFQKYPFEQAKLVRVLHGEVLDVAVDLRKESQTYLESFTIRLSAENKKQLFIPRGFAHGFVVLSETAEFFYKCDNYYSKEHEDGVRYDDITFGVDWLLKKSDIMVSDKDKELPTVII